MDRGRAAARPKSAAHDRDARGLLCMEACGMYREALHFCVTLQNLRCKGPLT